MAETLEEHYRRLLGLEEPWVVEDVDLDLAGQRVEIRLRTRSGLKMPCPECAVPYALYDYAFPRLRLTTNCRCEWHHGGALGLRLIHR